MNFIDARKNSLPGRVDLWFNNSVMPKWVKPTLFAIGLVCAALISTNPSFVLPYKYHFVQDKPVVVTSEDKVNLPEVETLPDESMSQSELKAVEELVLEPTAESADGGAQVAAAAVKLDSRIRVAGNLSIPSLKISAPLVYVTERSEKVFQLGLQQGVVQYPGTALPGQLGNMYVFGHSSDYRWSKGSYKTVFAKLPNIKVGSLIILTDGAGKTYTYKTISTVIALPTDTKYLSQYKFQRKLLTVQTSYPVGTALKRFLVQAELVEK